MATGSARSRSYVATARRRRYREKAHRRAPLPAIRRHPAARDSGPDRRMDARRGRLADERHARADQSLDDDQSQRKCGRSSAGLESPRAGGARDVARSANASASRRSKRLAERVGADHTASMLAQQRQQYDDTFIGQPLPAVSRSGRSHARLVTTAVSPSSVTLVIDAGRRAHYRLRPIGTDGQLDRQFVAAARRTLIPSAPSPTFRSAARRWIAG